MNHVHSFLFVLVALLPSFAASATDTRINQAAAVKIVSAIPEVKAWAKHIEKQTSGKSRVVLRPSDTVNLKEGKEYWSVAFFEDNGSYYHLWQSFLVSLDGGTVLVESATEPSESPQTLEEWRKTKNPLKGITQ
jgi:hypothetical protein